MVKYQFGKTWNWCQEASSVETRHMHTVYRTDSPRCAPGACKQNCAQNPYCLNILGEKKLTNSSQKESNEAAIADRSKYMRELNNYAGLVNLGATCYINTYLQVWFNNPFFRETVLKIHFDAPKCENGASTKSDDVIALDAIPELRLEPNENLAANLKMIFLLLKYSKRKSIDPNFFIKALNLDENMQQVRENNN